MSDASSVDAFLSQAGEREKAYDWLGAVELYKSALGSVPVTDFLKRGQIQERTGYAFYRAALQAESVNQFRERMPEAAACYERAKEFYSRLGEPGKTPWMLRCDAMIAYVGYWLTSEVSEKKRLLDECWKITKEALKAFKEAGNALEHGKTYNQLWWSAYFSFEFEKSFQVEENIVKEAMEHGEQAIKSLSTCRSSHELARAYVNTAIFLGWFGYFYHDLDEQEKYLQEARDYWQKSVELSEEVAFIESSLRLLSSLVGGIGTDKALKHFEKALKYARRTRDRLMVGSVLEMLIQHTCWASFARDPDEAIKFANKALEYAEEAKRQYSTISYASSGAAALWVEAPYAEHYWSLASLETNLSKRRELLEKAMQATPDMLSRAEKSGILYSIHHVHHVVGKVLTSQAMIEPNSEEKKRLLEKAIEHRNETIKYYEQHRPFSYWDRGLMRMYLARTKSELAKLAKDLESEKNMLQEAIEDAENGLKLIVKDLASQETRGVISAQNSALSDWQCEYGNLLKRLYDITHRREYLMKAVEAFEDSAKSAQKLDLVSRVAESNWKIAQTCDALGQHLKAAESFDLASGNYKSAAEKIPQLKDFYQDHATYMQAWSEIEKARHDHVKQKYGSAEEHFNKAASLHKSMKQWSYLAPNYEAWTQVEHAEELSRKEQSEEAIRAFERAAKLFSETKTSIQTELNKIENTDEKQMATSIVKATDLREKYCIGRISIEEAKILDKKGDHYSSSEKYDVAAQTFEKITGALESEQDRKELKLIMTLSRAWQKMMMAEAKASPTMYGEAAELFEQAKEYALDQPTSLLALANSSFCKALEVGTEFEISRDTAFFSTAKKHMEAAANNYLKAGFKNSSEYAKATELLFDAYMHVDNAKKETDPEKGTKLYTMTEKILQASAGFFTKAEHPEKRDQVLRLLEKVKEERELAMSLAEVLHAPSIISTTTAFSTPIPTHEKAVGSERFEHADIQANMIIRQKELKVGESLHLEIELVNAGKSPALLTKITEVIPEGFELAERPEIYRVEDSYIDMKGKRLDPLKMVEVKLVLKPRVQGAFPIKPRILYIDENGKYKSHEPEPITITVKELGIKGWIKGER